VEISALKGNWGWLIAGSQKSAELNLLGGRERLSHHSRLMWITV